MNIFEITKHLKKDLNLSDSITDLVIQELSSKNRYSFFRTIFLLKYAYLRKNHILYHYRTKSKYMRTISFFV